MEKRVRSQTSTMGVFGLNVKRMPSHNAFRQTTLGKLATEVHAHCWTWRSGGAVLGLCGGIVSVLLGSVLTAISWFTGPDANGLALQRYGAVGLFLTIPLLICGGVCLDLMEKHATEARKRRLNLVAQSEPCGSASWERQRESK
jgi:hypothetical protein